MQLKGSKTEKNLEAALAGESIARNKYTFYAGKAKADGYEQIAQLFEETAHNEKAHAEMWYNLLTGKDKTTQENLQLAADGEFCPCVPIIYGGFEVTTSKEAAPNRLPASLISPVTMEILSSRSL